MTLRAGTTAPESAPRLPGTAMVRRRVVGALALIGAAFLSACPGTPTTPVGPAPGAGGPARRIVCGNAAAAEFACRLVGADRVVGLPSQADEWGSMDLRTRGFESVARFAHYTAENVLVLAPDLVVTHAWQNPDTTSILRGRGIDVVVLKSATSYADIRDTLLELGGRLGAAEEARVQVDALDARVHALAAGAAPRGAFTAMAYANNGTGGTTAGANTTPDTLIRLAGLRNAAAEGGLVGHVALDVERLLALDPDFLVVASPASGEGGSPTRAWFEAAAGLERLKARRGGHVVVLSPAWMSADSPPLVDAAEFLAREVDRVLDAESAAAPK